jgi:hypothetical protein
LPSPAQQAGTLSPLTCRSQTTTSNPK